jgi:hypothetical protein
MEMTNATPFGPASTGPRKRVRPTVAAGWGAGEAIVRLARKRNIRTSASRLLHFSARSSPAYEPIRKW